MVNEIRNHFSGVITHGNNDFIICNDTDRDSDCLLYTSGIVDKKWADRLMLGFTYSHMYKEIQTGVRQEIVYGEKHRKGKDVYKRQILYMPLKLITVNILIRIIPILRQVDIFLIKVARREKAFSSRILLL